MKRKFHVRFRAGENPAITSKDYLSLLVAWRTTAEFVSKYFTKGRMAVVFGRLQLRDWTDREGNKRRAAEVIADSVYFGDSKPADAQSKAAQNFTAASNSVKELPENFNPFSEVEPADGELPF